ncbi:Glycosyltransferase involved in cell wall bisynthesis [Cyclonatronum proteinivorum]|uniref:Glycosyltransferase involved in cell wall bisynthesis n=1 Tax=Cyclonatronum proteinivorum TaxID=1457365 RepID=A0A345UMG5_9BACT|nr:glycosyltransferase [Cyclonatronum proteinivorum]AXJ01667.1 Glycosyltransferase involved in cell wall bisynthesis [Cyclonatronum proteinivorum]
MKIVINTAHQRFGGAVQVALSFISECVHFTDHEYHVWLGHGVGKEINTSDFPVNFSFYEHDFGTIGFRTIPLIQKTLAQLEDQIKPDIIIATSGPTYYNSKAPQIIGFNLPLYIYPESPYVQQMSLKQKLKLWLKKKAHYYYFKRDAAAYVVQTDDVNNRVQKALGTSQVHTVTNTHSKFYLQDNHAEPKLSARENGEIRLLTLSSYYPHKNLEIIPKVADLLIKEGYHKIRFVLTLKPQDFDNYIGTHPAIMNVGPVRPQDCPSLYEECDFMFLPTLAECFSASYAEAMVMKKPIITTDLGFARSICGDAALYFEPKNPQSAYLAIKRLLNNQDLCNRLVIKGLEQLKTFDTAPERAQKYLEICKSLNSK